MRKDIQWNEKRWGGNPHLFHPDNVHWSLIGSIDPYYTGPSSTSGSNEQSPDSFYWFRILLFTLLIVSPCCRAGFLWWAGGGRLHFTRNKQGRITGLQYVPYVVRDVPATRTCTNMPSIFQDAHFFFVSFRILSAPCLIGSAVAWHPVEDLLQCPLPRHSR